MISREHLQHPSDSARAKALARGLGSGDVSRDDDGGGSGEGEGGGEGGGEWKIASATDTDGYRSNDLDNGMRVRETNQDMSE